MKRKPFKTAGFTLVETLIAMAVFSLVIVGALSMVNSEWTIIRKTQEELFITRVLETQIEAMRDLRFDEIVALGDGVPFDVEPTGEALGYVINPQIVSDYTMKLIGDGVEGGEEGRIYLTAMNDEMIKVVAAVRWQPAGKARDRTLRMVTYITKNGVSKQ